MTATYGNLHMYESLVRVWGREPPRMRRVVWGAAEPQETPEERQPPRLMYKCKGAETAIPDEIGRDWGGLGPLSPSSFSPGASRV